MILHLILTHDILDEGFRNTRLHPLSPNLRWRYHRLRSHWLCPIDRSWSDCWSSGQHPSSVHGHDLMEIWHAHPELCGNEHGTD
jgi:hypothetical protein